MDTDVPGDRANSCRGMMEPVGVFTRRTGEYVLVHRCTKCHFERYNRVAGDDELDIRPEQDAAARGWDKRS